MADTSHPNPSDVIHYGAADERIRKHRSSPVALIIGILLAVAVCFLAFKLKHETGNSAELQAQLDRTNAELNTTKSNLATANANAAKLQSQLDESNKKSTDLQAQVTKADEASTALQSQLDKAKKDFQSQQETAQTQTTDLQAQITKANEGAASLRTELTTARTQIDDLKNQLAQARDQATKAVPAAAASTRALPLGTEFKKSFFGGIYSLQLKNTGSEPLNLNLTITGSDKVTSPQTAKIEAGKTFKLDGLAAGAKVMITGDGFEPLTVTAQ